MAEPLKIDEPSLSWKHKNMDKWNSNQRCACCGKKPESKIIIDNKHYDPDNKQGMWKPRLMFDFHFHHLIYKDGIIFMDDIGVDVCNHCHGLQKGAKTPINRFLRLMETTKRDDIKAFCRSWLNSLRTRGIGRAENTWKSTYDLIFKVGD